MMSRRVGDEANWTEEKINKLKELWPTGVAARAIGVEINMSKNAVIGKAHRLGLEKRVKSPQQRSAAAKEGIRNRKEKQAPAPKALPPTPPPPPPVVPITGGVPLMGLENHHCRAVIGHGLDGLARFCGATKRYRMDEWGRYKTTPSGEPMFHGSFCPGHAAVFYDGIRRR